MALAKEHVTIHTLRLDVLKQQEIAEAVQHTGTPDILVNCSGWVHHGTILDCDEEAWDRSFELNVKAHYRVIRAYLPGMLRHRGGSVINIASVASSIKGVPNRFVYGATKGAVIALTKQLAMDYIARNIRCNAICPGTVDTPSLNDRMRAQGDYDKARAAFIARQPLGRMASADEIGHLAVYLASDESAFVTGQIHIIDGGFTL
jgi:2-keto-3-deoxy-L-fuconate dehydrogenase